jgi:hypothetical protein
MDNPTRELFRENLIAQLACAGAIGMKLAGLKLGARAGGHEISDKEMVDELDYLEGKGLVAPIDKLISPENRRWKITAAGRDFAAAHGLG